MRAAIFVVVFTLNSIALNAQSVPEWDRVYTFDESTIEMNTSLVTLISKDVSRVRFRWNFTQPQSLGKLSYQSQLEVFEFNCKQNTYRPYHLTYLDATGNIVSINDSPGDWHSVPLGSMTEKLFTSGCDLIKKKTSPRSDEDVRLEKVAGFAHAFQKDLERTKDFKPLIDRFFMANYLAGYLQDQHTNWFMNLERDTASKVSKRELQRFYVAQMNAGYLTSLYLISQLPSPPYDLSAVQGLLPPDVLQLARSHPYTARYKVQAGNYDFLGENIDSVARMRSYIDLLEKISSLMRQHVDRVRAAETREWRAMLRYWTLYQPSATVCGENCLGLPAGTKLFDVNVPVFRLQVAEVSGKLKVVSAISRF